MRESQYIDSYINSGLTVNTFLAYRLQGRAKKWGGRYALALRRSVESRDRRGSISWGVTSTGCPCPFSTWEKAVESMNRRHISDTKWLMLEWERLTRQVAGE